jgi:hypothetical protein
LVFTAGVKKFRISTQDLTKQYRDESYYEMLGKDKTEFDKSIVKVVQAEIKKQARATRFNGSTTTTRRGDGIMGINFGRMAQGVATGYLRCCN